MALVLFILVSCCFPALILCTASDLTLVAEQAGTNVVLACIAKLEVSGIFLRDDQQLIRRIAYVETTDGEDPSTYIGLNNNGGIWQLSEAKYTQTKTSTSAQVLQQIQDIFNIQWTSTSWEDLRKPFFSALAARLYLDVLVPNTNDPFPFSTNIPAQSEFWLTRYTTSDKTAEDYSNAAVLLNDQEKCEVGALDLFYLLDDSQSLTLPNFIIIKDFAANMTRNFPIASDRVRIGLITFEYRIRIPFFLNTFDNVDDIVDAINATQYNGVGTNTSGALEVVRQQGFTVANGARPKELGVPRIAIVVTDGLSFEREKTVASAAKLHADGVLVYAIGIANANQEELDNIASDPRYSINVASFDETILSALQVSISRVACQVSSSVEPNVTITSTVTKNSTKFIDFPLTPNGITIKVNSTECRVILFGSTLVTTPNEALHDIAINTTFWEDVFLNVSDVFNSGTATRLYLSITGGGDVPCEARIGSEEGDVSTESVQVTNFPSTITRANDESLEVMCTAIGKPKPSSVQWYLNGTLIDSSVSGMYGISITQDLQGTTDSISSTLTIQSVTIGMNEGVYTCTGTNDIPIGEISDSSSFILNIIPVCPMVGTPNCYNRIIQIGCRYIQMTDESNLPMSCRNIL